MMYNIPFKNRISILCAFVLVQILFVACKKNETAAPSEIKIEDLEIGTGNSKIGYPGESFHIETNIIAATKLENVKLQITSKNPTMGWSFSQTYIDGFNGVKNANFHKDIPIGTNAVAGVYQLLLIVKDQNGTSKTIEDSFEIIKDTTLPTLSNTQIKHNSGVLNLTTNVAAPNKIADINIEVQSAAWTRNFNYTDADLVGKTSYALNKNIDMSEAPNGHYHVNIRVTDQAGKNRFSQYHLDK